MSSLQTQIGAVCGTHTLTRNSYEVRGRGDGHLDLRKVSWAWVVAKVDEETIVVERNVLCFACWASGRTMELESENCG